MYGMYTKAAVLDDDKIVYKFGMCESNLTGLVTTILETSLFGNVSPNMTTCIS